MHSSTWSMVNIASQAIGPLQGIPKPDIQIFKYYGFELVINRVSPKIIVESVMMV